MQDSFSASLSAVLLTEGGYVNNPRDPGGPTNKGITLATARKFISPSFTVAELRELTVPEAGKVYSAEYWNRNSCNTLPYGIDYAVFDYGVNSGPARAAHVLQAIVGVSQDGIIGPSTMIALSARDPIAVIDAYCKERLAFLRSLPTWPEFGAGWANRVNGVRIQATAMARGKASSDVTAMAAASLDMAQRLPTGKGTVKRPPSHTTTGTSYTAGAVGAVAATTHYYGGYAALGLTLAAVAGGAVLIAKLQSNMDKAAVTPAPGAVPVAPIVANVANVAKV